MRARRAWLLWLLAWCGPLLLACFGITVWRSGRSLFTGDASFENIYPNIIFGALVPLLGAMVLSRMPRHPMGWLFLACGLSSAMTLAVYPAAELGLDHHLAVGTAAAWVSEWIWGLGVVPLVTLGVLLFPDGTPPGPRWRWLMRSDLLAVALLFVSNAFHPGRLVNHNRIRNPVGLPVAHQVFDVLGGAAMALFAIGLVGGVAAVVVRWRRAERQERAQITWFALAVATLAAVVLLPLKGGAGATVATVVSAIAIPMIPVSVAVAILRNRLWGIDLVVRRSLVYAALTSLLLLGYAVMVALAGTLLPVGRDTGSALVATALVAVAFAPLRSRLQTTVDRMLYGDRNDPYAVLTGVGRQLGDTDHGPDGFVAEMAATVASSLRLPYVRIDIPGAGEDGLTGRHGVPVEDVHAVPLTYRGSEVGRMLVAPRTVRDPFRPADLRLLDDLGRQIGAAAHAVRLAAELQRSREEIVSAREEERRRIRRDLHDGLGPALAGIALGLDAVHRLAPSDASAAAALADQLKLEVQASLADVRRLVEDLRPPALDQLGLVGAVRQQARLLSERDPGLEVTVEAHLADTLPAAVEVAAYRIATEALTNVSRHAAARHCRVGLSLNGDAVLLLEVEDDGVGIAQTRRAGVGLVAMRERAAELGGVCEAGPATLGGTCVRARLPVGSS